MKKLSAHITRKEIAMMLGDNISPRWVKNNEEKLGLDKARVMSIRQPVLYRTRAVLVILAGKGFDVSEIRTIRSSVADLST